MRSAPVGSGDTPAPALPPAPQPVQIISLYQKQETIHPRTVTGWYQRWRWAMVGLTQALFYGLPWLKWNDRQAVLFQLETRRFYILDLVLYPQDFIYLAALLIISAYSLFLFTAVAGRLWCGYACPQTVYTEIFMWIERRLEGNRNERIRRDRSPWTADAIGRKAVKHALWITLSLWTGFTFVGYFTPITELWAESFTLSFGPWEWFWVVFYAGATYGFAGHLREQVCKYMCPYARFQSAMFDPDTLVISYDQRRGEPRGTHRRGEHGPSIGKGSCIDCGLCVEVCPTGIDIRKGLQYECIGCAACIDVCNSVMDKMHDARGLIRYDTQRHMSAPAGSSSAWRRVLRPRVWIYGLILLAIVGGVLVSLSLRHPFKVDVIRDRNALARLGPEGQVQNVYRLQLMNASEGEQSFFVTVDGPPGLRIADAAGHRVPAAQARWVPLGLEMDPEHAQVLQAGSHPVHLLLEVRSTPDGRVLGTAREKTTFIVPR